MRVTGFDLKKSVGEGSAVAFGRVVLDNLIEVDVRIMNGKNGLFISYPGRKGAGDRWFSQFKFIDRQVGDDVQNQIIAYYEKNVKTLP